MRSEGVDAVGWVLGKVFVAYREGCLFFSKSWGAGNCRRPYSFCLLWPAEFEKEFEFFLLLEWTSSEVF